MEPRGVDFFFQQQKEHVFVSVAFAGLRKLLPQRRRRGAAALVLHHRPSCPLAALQHSPMRLVHLNEFPLLFLTFTGFYLYLSGFYLV